MDLLVGRCRMQSLWASLVREDCGQTGMVVRVLQSHAELALDQPVGHPLVVVIKPARHRRERGGFEWHERRRRYAEQRRGVSDDSLGWRRVVVADVVDGPGSGPADRGGEHTCQILDMDAREYL